jgi:transcriptional regulator GlxA family with amidase domain
LHYGCEHNFHRTRGHLCRRHGAVRQEVRAMTYFSNSPADPAPRRIGFLGFDGVTTLDLTGPLEAFAAARIDDEQQSGRQCYETIIVGVSDKTFVSRSGATFKAQHTLRRAPEFDTIVIPGGVGLRNTETADTISEWLGKRASTTRRIVSICAGIYPLATAGLLDGRAVTTHWRYAGEVARAFPRLKVNSSAAFLIDGPFYTCGGGTAGIEMSLRMIEEDFGMRSALDVARELVMSLRPPGDEHQPTLPDHQTEIEDRLAELPGWITSRLRENLSVEVLAERACLCPRHFSRVFKRTFRSTPAEFVEQLRIAEAERRLATQKTTIESIAASVGFKSAEVFRRAFERRHGLTPSRFQRESRLNAAKALEANRGALNPAVSQ